MLSEGAGDTTLGNQFHYAQEPPEQSSIHAPIGEGLSGENSLPVQSQSRWHILIRRHQFNMLPEGPVPSRSSLKKFPQEVCRLPKDNPGAFAFFHHTDPPEIGPIVHISQSMSFTLHPPTIRSAVWSSTSMITH